jgi:hypothetical protein
VARSSKARALASIIVEALSRNGWEKYSGDNPEFQGAWISENVVAFFYHSRDMKRMYHIELWQGSDGKHTGFIHEDELEKFIATNQKPTNLRKVRG